MNFATSAPNAADTLEALVQRLAFDAPRLTDLSREELEQLARVVIMTNLRDDLKRRAELARIDYEREVNTFLSNASRSGSWATISAYTYSLARFDGWVVQHSLDALDLTPRQADEYIYSLRLAGRSPGTIRLEVAAVSAFFSFLERRYDVVRNPFRGTRARPAYRPTREIVIPDEAELRVVLQTARPWLKAAIACMCFRGLRVGALPTLTIDEGRFSGWSKGKAVNGILPSSALAAIEEAGLDRRRPFFGVFSVHIADRVRRHAYRLVARKMLRSVYSAHDYRHYFAVHEYRAVPDMYRLKKLLGHYDLRTTERYLKTLKIL